MKLAENMKKGFPSKGIRKTPTRKILTHHTPPAPPAPPGKSHPENYHSENSHLEYSHPWF